MENPLLDLLIDVRDNVGVKHPATWGNLDRAIEMVERGVVAVAPLTDPIKGRCIFGPCLIIPLPVPVVATNDDIKDAKAAIEATGALISSITHDQLINRVALAIAKSRAERKKT